MIDKSTPIFGNIGKNIDMPIMINIFNNNKYIFLVSQFRKIMTNSFNYCMFHQCITMDVVGTLPSILSNRKFHF